MAAGKLRDAAMIAHRIESPLIERAGPKDRIGLPDGIAV
jgi:hypothetical protein